MPEHLLPKVYVEEAGDVPVLEGVPTTIAAFVGAFQSGPVNQAQRLTSVEQLETVFGSQESEASDAIRQFFSNGGRTCWAVRVESSPSADTENVIPISTALHSLDDVDSFNLLSIPATSELSPSAAAEIIALAENYCELRRAFLLIDPPQSLKKPDDVRVWLHDHPSIRHRNAAVYFPRVRIRSQSDPSQLSIVAPSGTMAGVIARTDEKLGVWKAPAGQQAVLENVVGLEYLLTSRENESLNRESINCLREFPQIGLVCWGARTISDDPEWKYLHVRRLVMFVERSIDDGLQWVEFEPNGERLWAQVRGSVNIFLINLWREGALQGMTQVEAFFVKCDITTMTQDDIDNGRLNVVVGVAPVKPAEFVIVRIGLWTADRDP